MKFRTVAFGAIAFAFLAACTTEAPKGGSSAPADEEPTEEPEGNAGGEDTSTDASETSPMPAARECGAVTTKTSCRTGGDSAIIRGVARFDPALLSGSGKPVLTLFLRHSFIIEKGEDQIGGRLHAEKRITLKDSQRKSGLVPFELDMCAYGVEMWSEENGLFNVVAILDEKDAHDINNAKTADEALEIETPVKGELVKMVTGIKVSCHGESPCLDVPLECKDGTKCTTIKPIDKIDCETPSCASDDSFCKGTASH